MKTKYVAYAAALTLGVATVSMAGGALAPAMAGTRGPGPASKVIPGSEGDAVGSTAWGDVTPSVAEGAVTGGVWSAARDAGSLYALEKSQGVHAAWARGYTGKDITVAVIDTGIAPVVGLEGDRVVNGPDLSVDAQTGLTPYVDAFGHGTHLAGIIAGRDKDWDKKKPDPTLFAGVAPEAKLLNVKVGSADGGADVSQVIAALAWVTQHRNDDGMHVRVISLAYGTASTQPWQVDPLAHAVESAWRAGIVVVTAAGNDGLGTSSLLMPAVDPHVIAVGASDPMGTEVLTDDVVADFTSGGNDTRRPDVLAPGRSVVSLRVPGSYADTTSPGGRVSGDVSGRYFRGSGTSQATAFVAGEVALLLSARPTLTPDQVKALLVGTALPLATPQPAQGAGVVNILAAAAAPVPARVLSMVPFSTGTGSLELSRGGEHLVDPGTGAVLSGEVDIMGGTWNPLSWSILSSTGRSWTKGTWNGRVWTGESFKDKAWAVTPWTGTSWGAVPWASYRQTSAVWSALSWRGDGWSALSWRGDSWEALSWRQDSWRALSWRSVT